MVLPPLQRIQPPLRFSDPPTPMWFGTKSSTWLKPVMAERVDHRAKIVGVAEFRVRACHQLSQTTLATRWTAARKFRAVFS